MTLKSKAYFRSFLLALIGFALITSPTLSQVQSKDQRKCIREMNNAFDNVGRAKARVHKDCLRARLADQLPTPLDACMESDPDGEVAEVEAETFDAEADFCVGSVPDFGYAPAATVNYAAIIDEEQMIYQLFGAGAIDTAVEPKANDPAKAQCQLKILRGAERILKKKRTEFLHCKNAGLIDGSITNDALLEACYQDVKIDVRQKIVKPIEWLERAVARYCTGQSVDVDVALPGNCVGASDFTECANVITDCRLCQSQNASDTINEDCDIYDDGLANGSCDAVSCSNGSTETGEDCDDGNLANGDCCSSTCSYESSGGPCTDGNVCTDDQCDGAGTCVSTNNTVQCDDGLFCNGDGSDLNSGDPYGGDTCAGGSCSVHTGDPCLAVGTECQIQCNEGPDTCADNAGLGCTDDGNVCTDDVCDGGGSCVHPNNSAPCTDSVFCNGTDTCTGGACTIHTGDPCPGPDGDGNCSESCDEALDNCALADLFGSACDDSVFCNGTDTCSAGLCNVHTGDPCPGTDVGPDCDDSCDESADDCAGDDASGTGCVDGLFCTSADQCNGTGTCIGGPDPCPGPDGDGNCSESCDEVADNCLLPDSDGVFCDDGVFCNGTDQCLGGLCQVHTGDPCTGPDGDNDCAESCNESSDNCLANDPDGAACLDEGDICTNDQCSTGICAHPDNANCKFVTTAGAGTSCTPSTPCSLTTGLAQVVSGYEVRAAGGTYTISNELTGIQSNTTLAGGYVVTGPPWTQTAGCTATHIFRDATNPDGSANVDQRIVAVQLSSVSGFNVECLRISTANATGSAGMSTYGLHMTSASSYAFTDVTINAGNAAPGAAGTNGGNGTTGSVGLAGTAGLADGSTARSGGQGGNGQGTLPGTGALGSPSGTGGNGGDSTDTVSGGGGGGGGGGGFHGTGGNGGEGGGVNSGANQTPVGVGGAGGTCVAAAGTGTGGSNGGAGAAGTNGSAGSAGSQSTFWLNGGLAGTGTNGTGGLGGAGGGGGGGQNDPAQPGPSPTCIDGVGAGGGGGGGGGRSGTGGTGGRGGGSSYAVYLVTNGASGVFNQGARTAGTAGAGGAGGSGGSASGNASAGAGGAAATGVGGGGSGGTGGAGGAGGAGGSGSAGQSIAVVTQSGTAPTINP